MLAQTSRQEPSPLMRSVLQAGAPWKGGGISLSPGQVQSMWQRDRVGSMEQVAGALGRFGFTGAERIMREAPAGPSARVGDGGGAVPVDVDDGSGAYDDWKRFHSVLFPQCYGIDPPIEIGSQCPGSVKPTEKVISVTGPVFNMATCMCEWTYKCRLDPRCDDCVPFVWHSYEEACSGKWLKEEDEESYSKAMTCWGSDDGDYCICQYTCARGSGSGTYPAGKPCSDKFTTGPEEIVEEQANWCWTPPEVPPASGNCDSACTIYGFRCSMRRGRQVLCIKDSDSTVATVCDLGGGLEFKRTHRPCNVGHPV